MAQRSVPEQNQPQRREPANVDQPQIDPVWLRLSLVFLLGLLLGTLLIAATRPLPPSGRQSSDPAVNTTDNPVCDQVAEDSEHVADLGGRAAAAARHQDATSLTNLMRELNDAQNTLDRHVAGCHR
jgi:hypothetical protein